MCSFSAGVKPTLTAVRFSVKAIRTAVVVRRRLLGQQ
jgi:hypothetical protein